MPIAITHWELCLAQNPNMILALNNLAVALSQSEPPQLDRSLELLDRATKIAGPDPELLDSKGEVLMRAGRTQEAVTSFEQSISLDNKRIPTRRRLAEAYRKLGLIELALAQEELVEKVQQSIKP
jgi:tetratricopeptide (TPR) repeat protein